MDNDEIVITKEGSERLQAELRRLTTIDRPEATARVREAKRSAEDFDTSEYENAKMDQAIIEGRIEEIRSILRRSVVLRDEDIPTDVVGIGSHVRVKDLDLDESWDLRIVGPIEADPSEDRISYESPVGSALMGKKVRDTIEVKVPDGTIKYKITKISK
ncbi:MAG TPA: transcription elongation factor GreA [Armatimonadota bacterium]|nr:transcription elongation factor GreA [Armatimonadota bacterium]HQK96248.1 transcription elongation factor GreA [Armatimonadota bacterium]